MLSEKNMRLLPFYFVGIAYLLNDIQNLNYCLGGAAVSSATVVLEDLGSIPWSDQMFL